QRFDRMAQEYGLGTAAVAYRQIESIIAGQGSNVQALLRQRGLIDEALPRHLQIQQVADNLLRPENIAFLRSFRREFVDAFVTDLPDAAGKIREINSEAERVAVVTQLIGHAAWAASFQIEQALTAMRENTNRLLSVVLTGLDAFDKEQRKGWLQRGWGALVDA